MTDQQFIARGAVVYRKPDDGTKQPRGIVLAKFDLPEHQMDDLVTTPVSPGSYAVVIWHNRMRPRVERFEELVVLRGAR